MKLYMPVSTSLARHIIDDGFYGIPRLMTARDGSKDVYEVVVMYDQPPTGLVGDRSTEFQVETTDERIITMTGTGGKWFTMDIGDFTMVIEVPDKQVAQYEIREDPPKGWPFREYWMPPEFVNRHRHTLSVLNSQDGEEVRADLV